MIQHHVFVETNWVVAIVAPTLGYREGARELLQRVRRGELTLHVPAIALAEAHKVVRERAPRTELDAILDFVDARKAAGDPNAASAGAMSAMLSQFRKQWVLDQKQAPASIAALRNEPINFFALDEQMLNRSLDIAAQTSLALQSFDLAILAAVLTRAEALHAAGARISFCETDSDLQPWRGNSVRTAELTALYDAAGVWVYSDFLFADPVRPEVWPRRDA